MDVGWIFGRISVVAQYIRRILLENGGFWAKMEHFSAKWWIFEHFRRHLAA